jgi:hypothetical protein
MAILRSGSATASAATWSLTTRLPVTLTFLPGPLRTLGDVELDLLPFLQAAVATAGDRAELHVPDRPPRPR